MQQFHLELDNWSSISVKKMILCFLLHAGEEEKNRERESEREAKHIDAIVSVRSI